MSFNLLNMGVSASTGIVLGGFVAKLHTLLGIRTKVKTYNFMFFGSIFTTAGYVTDKGLDYAKDYFFSEPIEPLGNSPTHTGEL